MYKWTFYPVRQYSSGFSWEAEPIQFIGIDIGGRVIIGIGSHDYGSQEVPNLLSASWRTREASLVIQSEFLRLEGLMVEISVWVWKPKNQKHSVWEQEKRKVSSHAERANSSSTFVCLFVLFRPSRDWMVPTGLGEGNCLYLIYRFQCQCLPETLAQTYQKILLYHLSGHLLAHSSSNRKLVITSPSQVHLAPIPISLNHT